mgnify:CR=1 FL=1
MEQIYEWIARVIETCNNDFHFEAVDKLIELFYEKYQNEKLKTQLEHLRIIKWKEIHIVLQ